MTRQGLPIEQVSIRDAITTGIAMEPLLPGLVPFYEEREAAVYGHYSWVEWRTLEPEERAFAVAQYRMHYLIEMHHSDAVNTAMERRRAQQQQAQG